MGPDASLFLRTRKTVSRAAAIGARRVPDTNLQRPWPDRSPTRRGRAHTFSLMIGQRRRDLAFDAQGERIVGRFVTGSKVQRDEVERLIVRWAELAERAGVRRDSPGYWNACRRWIAGQRESASAARKTA